MIKKFNDYIKEDNNFEHITTPEDEIVALFTQHPKFGIHNDNQTGSYISPDPEDNLVYYEIIDNTDPKRETYIELFFDVDGNIDDTTDDKPSDENWVKKRVEDMESGDTSKDIIDNYKEMWKLLSEWI